MTSLCERQSATKPTDVETAIEVARSRAFARLRACGFTVEQARAMAVGGLDVAFLPVDLLFFGLPARNSPAVIAGGTR